MPRATFTEHLNVRLSKPSAIAFHKQSESEGGASVVIRTMIDAYLDGRIFIKPKPQVQFNPQSKQ